VHKSHMIEVPSLSKAPLPTPHVKLLLLVSYQYDNEVKGHRDSS